MNSFYVSRIFKGLISTSLGTISTIIIGFANITLAVRMITKEQFGTYLLLQVIVYSLVMVSDIGINLSATRSIACANEIDKDAVVNATLKLKAIIIFGVTFLIATIGQFVLIKMKFEAAAIYVLPLAILFMLESACATNYAIIQGLQLYKKLALSQLTLSLLNLVTMVAMLQILANGLHALIGSRIISLTLTLLYQKHAMQLKLHKVFEKDLMVKLLKFGYPLGVNNILTFIFTRIDTLMIGAMLNPISVAYYGTASKLPDAGRQMFESFRSVYFPNVAELFEVDRKCEAELVLKNSLRTITFLSTLCLLIVHLFRNEIVILLFTKKYLECASVLSLLMFSMIMSLIGYTLGTSLVAAGYSKLPVLINTVDASVAVISNLILIPHFGIVGAAYASILARVVTLPVNVFFLTRYEIRVWSMEFIKPLLILAASLLLSQMLPSSSIVDIAVIIVFIAASTLFSVITRKDIICLVASLKLEQATSPRD